MTHNWMRQAAVDILRYLPEFLAKSPRFKAANDADSKEHDTIRLDLQELLDQFYVASATYGLADWEEMVGITTDTSLSYESRRANVLAKLRKPESVTEAFLTELINRYIADQQGYILSYPAEYRIEILYHGGQVMDYDKLVKAVRTYIPAHLGYKLVTITNGTLEEHAAGVVQQYSLDTVDMSSGYTLTADDTVQYCAGAVTNQYQYMTINGGQ